MTYVEDEVVAEGGNEEDEKFGYCYYRLKSGWIGQGRADPASIETYKRKGCASLVAEYGRFVLNPAIIKDKKGNPLPQWQPFFQPYDKLLLDAPHEFPVEQVIAHQWHHGVRAQWIEYLADGRYKTHRRMVTFPQLAGLDIPDHLCVICGRSFTAPQHLNVHTRIAHPEQGTILELAKSQQAIAGAIGRVQGSDAAPALSAVLEQIVATQQQMGSVLAELLGQRAQPKRSTVRIRDEQGRLHGSRHMTPEEEAVTNGSDLYAAQRGGGADDGSREADNPDPEGAVAPA